MNTDYTHILDLVKEAEPLADGILSRTVFLTRLPERLKERVRLLRTGKSDLAVDDEERYAVQSMPSRKFLGLLDRFQTVIALHHGLGVFPVQASLGNHVEERLPVADVTTFGEVRQEQCLYNRILDAFLVGQPDEPVGIERVRGPLDPIKGEVDPVVLADRNHPSVEFLRALPASELLRAIFPPADAFLGHRGIELKGKPSHLHRPAMSGNGLL